MNNLPGTPATTLAIKPRWLGGVTLAVLCSASPAYADLTGEFQDLIDVDTEWVSGANDATDVAFAEDGRALVTRKGGQITLRFLDGTVTVLDYPFGGTLDTASEKGLLGVVSDPASPNTFYFYVSNGPNDDKHRVYRAELTEDDQLDVDDSPVVAASVGNGPGLEGPNNHDGGGLWIHDGFLYISVGDTGANATPPTNKYTSCLNKPNGSILRVGLDGSIPADNPLVGAGMVTGCDSTGGNWTMAAPDERIYTWGLRNAWRFWIDPQTDLMWIGDVGETTREELTIGTAGDHHGYPFNEGFQEWRTSSDLDGNSDCNDIEPASDCTEPVYDYENPGRGGGGGAMIGGLILDGCGWGNVFAGDTYYIFADSSQHWIRALPVNADRSGIASQDAIEIGSYSNGTPVSFRMGPDESLYLVLNGAGAVYRMTPADLTGDDCITDPMGEGGAGAGGETGEGGASQGGGGGEGEPAGGGGASGSAATGGSPGAGGDPGMAGAGQAAGGMVPNPEPTDPRMQPMGMAGGGAEPPISTPGEPEPAPAGTAAADGPAGAAGGVSLSDDGGSGDDGGCSTVRGSGSAPFGTAFLGTALLFGLSRRRRRS